LKFSIEKICSLAFGHAPRGACELKCYKCTTAITVAGHAPRGACELKFTLRYSHSFLRRHAPRGACELKSM